MRWIRNRGAAGSICALDKCLRACELLETDGVAHLLSKIHVHLISHTACHRHGSHTTWLCAGDEFAVLGVASPTCPQEAAFKVSGDVQECSHQLLVSILTHSAINWAIWVVLPLPVSPTRMVVWCWLIIFVNSSFACHTGKPTGQRRGGRAKQGGNSSPDHDHGCRLLLFRSFTLSDAAACLWAAACCGASHLGAWPECHSSAGCIGGLCRG